MKLAPRSFIDLTGHLSSLKSSLTPASKHFEPTTPLWQLARRPDVEAQTTITRLFIAFLIISSAIVLAYLATAPAQ
jgi:hypothetical protein